MTCVRKGAAQPGGRGERPQVTLPQPTEWTMAFVLLLCFACAEFLTQPLLGDEPGVFFVSPTGNDVFSGLLAAPEPSGTRGPFATPARALRAVREWRRQVGTNEPASATIYLRGGTYFLSEPLVLTAEDSGLVLRNYEHERPILSAGRPISDWRRVTVEGRYLWAAAIPEARSGKWNFRELWVNGRRAVRARHPNRGYFSVVELLDPVPNWDKGHIRFRFRAGDLKWWKTATSAEVVVFDRWVESRLPIFSIDEPEHVISFSKRSVFQLGPGDLYYLEGALEVLDEPGEWYLDSEAGQVYYLPMLGETQHPIEAVAPKFTQVLRLAGQPESGKFVDRVTVRGLGFAHSEWCFPESELVAEAGYDITLPRKEVGGFGQAAAGVPGAVWGSGVRQSVFEHCTFGPVGNYGLELTRGCQSNRIAHCDFHDLGAGGIKLGEAKIRDRADELTRANEVSDCRIFDGGLMFASAIGIWLGQTPDNRIEHNLIRDFYYTGISIGWTWGYGPSLASNNLVAYNCVHHIGVKSNGDGPLLSDLAGIYTLGRQPGTRILNNLWHDMAGLRYGGWGIYFDEGSTGILAQSNVVYRTTHGGFHQHYGATNWVQNNIFALGRDYQFQRTRAEDHLSFSFQTNLVYFNSGQAAGGDLGGDRYQLDWNLYFDTRPGASARTLRFESTLWEQWRQRGHDLHSRFADPIFVAPLQGDFRLRAGSPALTLGFQPIDLSQVGPREDVAAR